MDLKHEVAYRGIPSQSLVKAEPGVSHNGHNGHVRDWMAGGGSPSPAAGQPQPNGYSSPLSSGSYGPYSPNGKIGKQPSYSRVLVTKRSSTSAGSPNLFDVGDIADPGRARTWPSRILLAAFRCCNAIKARDTR
ncbi:unnamed protein product [Danaus chrysippus]|uniref:(African queen) hypothetical protein n=1 Tax=Danaus chrysippus TaxID=151541 RepID=A0A8J2WBA9_9NEOP|nr:unnamed protein product [Danaus chrysippus]